MTGFTPCPAEYTHRNPTINQSIIHDHAACPDNKRFTDRMAHKNNYVNFLYLSMTYRLWLLIYISRDWFLPMYYRCRSALCSILRPRGGGCSPVAGRSKQLSGPHPTKQCQFSPLQKGEWGWRIGYYDWRLNMTNALQIIKVWRVRRVGIFCDE
jgi:hypothetical protein